MKSGGSLNYVFFLRCYAVFLSRKLISFYNWMVQDRYKNEAGLLQQQIDYSVKNIPFYRSYGPDLNSFPILDKITCQANKSLLRNRWRYGRSSFTSGTTGSPSEYIRDWRSIAAEQYFLDRYYQRKSFYWIKFRGGKVFDLPDDSNIVYKDIPFIREMHVCTHRLNDATLEPFVRHAMNIPNKCLYASPSGAHFLAEFCARKKFSIRFDQIALSSEAFYVHQIELIKKVFQCPIMDLYGQVERVAALGRCSADHYHPLPNYSHIEFVDRGDNWHEIVGTAYYNRTMPLIRYATGDLVELSDSQCSCGSELPNITQIHGRKGDLITIRGNSFTGSLLSLALNKVKGLVESQFVVHGEQSMTLRMVTNDEFDDGQLNILKQSLSMLGPPDILKFEKVDLIERTPAGKFKFIVKQEAEK